ncbi:short chain oxidoreductase [Mycena albidolilacea]|uniref:Short chain oxidoreductase n=1 Tax=Mycena albidolilacea TaxID=1033008 RepID=A0AAD7EDB0_9AGAR|nr:short chain oxidoreductase [Mycena albidolilacea]
MVSKGTAVVTGAAQRIGRAIALRLAADGFYIALNDIGAKSNELQGVEAKIAALGCGAKTGVFTADVAVEDEVHALLVAVVEKFGGIHVLSAAASIHTLVADGTFQMVANAGICKPGSFLDVNIDDWDRTFAVNVRGVFLCYQYAAKQMVAQGRGGRIIGACSLAGKQGAPKLSTYSASKFAVRGLTQAAATELGPHGITVNAYAPGIIESPMTDGFAHLAGVDPKVIYDRQAAQTPVGKNGKPVDVAALVSFLASAESSFVTGQTISPNGGRYFD